MTQKQAQDKTHNQKDCRPVIRSVGNSKQIAGFMDTRTNQFTEVMQINNSRDMDAFLEAYDISVAEITKE